MSEEQVQDTVQENLDIKVENKPENADSGLLPEVMAKKATIKEQAAEIAELKAEKETRRQKKLSDDGKKDELIAELNSKVDNLTGENTRLSKYEDDEKTNLIASIASDEAEAETLSSESLSTLRLLKSKIASATPETTPSPTARGSVGNQPPPEDWTKMDERTRRRDWGNIIKNYKKN